MNKQLNAALRLSALSIALLAAGCGGGGGSSSSNGPDVATRSVSGTAAKGIIKGGLVQVFALDAQGTRGTSPVATATTGADGTFSVAIPKDLLLFVVEVSATAGAVMADEATGKDIPMPANMVMRNIVTLAAGAESYTGAVTPLTEMAVKAAEKADGGLTAANIELAKAGVRKSLGFDPETVKPVNSNSGEAVNATEEQKTQALVLAAISKMAMDGALGCVAADISCVVKNVTEAATLSGDGMTLGAATGAALETATQQVATDDTINRTGKQTVELPPAIKDPVVAPPQPPAPETGVESAKKLFASLRTNLNAIADSRTALEARADLVNADFQKMIAPVDEELANWVTVPSFAIDYLANYKAGVVNGVSVPVAGTGQCIVFSDDAFTTMATNAGDARNILCLVNKTLSFTFDPLTRATTHKFVSQVMAILPGSTAATYNYSAHSRLDTVVNGTRTSREVIGNYGNTANRGTGTITYTAGTSRANFAIKGQLPARTDASGAKISDYEYWDLKAVVAEVGTSTTYDLTSTMTSFLDGKETGTISVNPGSRLSTNAAPGVIEPNLVKEFSLSITGKSGESAITGSLNMTDWKGDKNKALYAPAVATFNGSLTQGGQAFFSGEVKYTNTGFAKFDSTLPTTDDNFLTQTVRLSGELAIPQRPALKMFLALTPGKADTQEVTAQYDDGVSVINFNGKRTLAAVDQLHYATISSTTGVSISVTQADLDAKRMVPVMKNSEKVALLNLENGVIYYMDGKFESLK
jgi:hypothetical protein